MNPSSDTRPTKETSTSPPAGHATPRGTRGRSRIFDGPENARSERPRSSTRLASAHEGSLDFDASLDEPETHMSIAVDPPRASMDLEASLPMMAAGVRPTKPTTSAGPTAPANPTAATSFSGPDKSKMSDAEYKKWVWQQFSQRKLERDNRVRAEAEQKELEQVRCQQQIGDKRPHPTNSPPSSIQTASVRQVQTMEVDEPLQIDCDEIDKRRSVKCAIRVNNGPIIGSPIAPLPGYGIKFAINSGRNSEPSIGIRIRVAKRRKDAYLDQLQDQEIDWTTVGWYPGTKIDGQYMLADFDASAVIDSQTNKQISHPDILKHCPAEKLPRLMCVRIRSQSSITGPFQEAAWRGLEHKVTATLQSVFVEKDPFLLTVWFLADPSVALLERNCISHFREAFIKRRPEANLKVGATVLPLPRWQMEYRQNGISMAWKTFEEKKKGQWKTFELKMKREWKAFERKMKDEWKEFAEQKTMEWIEFEEQTKAAMEPAKDTTALASIPRRHTQVGDLSTCTNLVNLSRPEIELLTGPVENPSGASTSDPPASIATPTKPKPAAEKDTSVEEHQERSDGFLEDGEIEE